MEYIEYRVKLELLRAKIISILEKIEKVRVFDYKNVNYDPSIIAFDLTEGSPLELKQKIQSGENKMLFTLPALITTEEFSTTINDAEGYYGIEPNMQHSLRISIDPYRLDEQTKYIDELLGRIESALV